MLRRATLVVSGVAALVLLAGCFPSAPGPSPSASAPAVALPTPTPTPTVPPKPAPTPKIAVDCGDLASAADVRQLAGPDSRSVDPLFEFRTATTGIPGDAAIMQVGAVVCRWSNLEPESAGNGINPDRDALDITVVPNSRAQWDVMQQSYGASSLSCYVGAANECSWAALVSDAWVTVRLVGGALSKARTDTGAEDLFRPFTESVTKTMSTAKAVKSTWNPRATALPKSCVALVPKKLFTASMGLIEPLQPDEYTDGPPVGPTVDRQDALPHYYCTGHAESSHGVGDISVLQGSEWAWDAIAAVRPDHYGATPAAVDGMTADDEAWEAVVDDVYALDLIHAGSWFHFSVWHPHPGVQNDDISASLRTLASTVIGTVDGAKVAIPAVAERSVPRPDSTPQLTQPAYEPHGGPNAIRRLTCESFGSDLQLSSLFGVAIGLSSTAFTAWAQTGDMSAEYLERQRGGTDCSWRAAEPTVETTDWDEAPAMRIAIVPLSKDEWAEHYESDNGSKTRTSNCDPYSGTCSLTAYANGQYIHVDVRGAWSSKDFQQRFDSFFDKVIDTVAHAARVRQEWVAPTAPPAFTSGCDAALSAGWIARATGLTKVSTDQWNIDDGLYLDLGATHCEWFGRTPTKGSTSANVGSITVLPGGSWAWAEIGTTTSSAGVPQAYRVAGLRSSDHAYLRYDDTKRASYLDLLLRGTWVQVSLQNDGRIAKPQNAFRVIAEQLVREANAG